MMDIALMVCLQSAIYVYHTIKRQRNTRLNTTYFVFKTFAMGKHFVSANPWLSSLLQVKNLLKHLAQREPGTPDLPKEESRLGAVVCIETRCARNKHRSHDFLHKITTKTLIEKPRSLVSFARNQHFLCLRA